MINVEQNYFGYSNNISFIFLCVRIYSTVKAFRESNLP